MKPLSFISLLFLTGSSLFAEISVSKDSLVVYNNPVMSWADQVMFINHNEHAVHVDSAFIRFDEFDTAGSGEYGLDGRLEAQWREHPVSGTKTYWTLEKTDAELYYRMVQRPDARSNAVPLWFSAAGDTQYIAMMQIGTCLECSGIPAWYPSYIRGTMKLVFTSGQTIFIRLVAGSMPGNDQPCTDYACDSTVVRKILDENGMSDVAVESFTAISGGRITRLQLIHNSAMAHVIPKPVMILSPEVGRLSALEQLELAGNELETLPATVGRLAKLKWLVLNNNRLDLLPDSIVNCASLRTLAVDGNSLVKLPDNLPQLSGLQVLSLSDNRLTSLSPGIENLDTLNCLFVAGNRLCELSPEVVAWVQNVQNYSLCSRWEPVWPDSQVCNNVGSTVALRQMPSAAIFIILKRTGIQIESGTPVHSARLFDASGRLAVKTAVRLPTNIAEATFISTASLRNGIYVLTVTAGHRTVSRRIVLQR